MKILLLGKNGQLGWELQRSLAPLGKIVALSRDSKSFCGDLTDLSGLTDTVRQLKPDIIVNAAAYTAVDKAETEPELAQSINVDAVNVLAKESKILGSLLVHYSTDYVFNGDGKSAWTENDQTDPVNVYGLTKSAGERVIINADCKYLIFRTSWVYSTKGNNFAKTMLHLAQERDSLTVIDDQVGSPTGADLLADVTAHAIRSVQQQPKLFGLYHLTSSGETSWYGYACFVIEYALKTGFDLKTRPEAISSVPSSSFVTPAKRPKNSRLNTRKLENRFDFNLPHWQEGVSRMLAEIIEKNNETA